MEDASHRLQGGRGDLEIRLLPAAERSRDVTQDIFPDNIVVYGERITRDSIASAASFLSSQGAPIFFNAFANEESPSKHCATSILVSRARQDC
jgi:hypothetical protein